MVTRIREVRRALGLTLDDVARRCHPQTTPQTIGRLETGARTVSVSWLKRIATALDVECQDLMESRGASELKVVATLGTDGVAAARHHSIIAFPKIADHHIGVLVTASFGDYRAGDELWCEVLAPQAYSRALNRDVLVPRSGTRFLFGRLINRDDQKLHILPPEAGARQQIVPSPPWLGVAARLMRKL